MKKLIIFLFLLVLQLNGHIFKIAHNEPQLKEVVENAVEELRKEQIKFYIFHNSKIYRQNGIFVGLIKKYIDFAIVKKEDLEKIVVGSVDNGGLEKIGFVSPFVYKEYYLIARKKFFLGLDKDKKSKILKIFEKQIKGM